MKTPTLLSAFSILVVVAGFGAGCSSSSTKPEQTATGPAVINAHTEPGTVELGTDLRPRNEAFVVADVKDYNANVNNVVLKFKEAPIEVQMENIGGTTWRGQLTPQQLQLLAVSGKSVDYKAKVEAKNNQGQTGVSQDDVTITVKTPDLSKPA